MHINKPILMATCAWMMGSLLLAAVQAEEFVFETATARLVLDNRGMCTSLRDKASSAEWIGDKPAAFITIRQNGAACAATRTAPP